MVKVKDRIHKKQSNYSAKHLILIFSVLFNLAFSQSGKLIISGIFDGPLTGGKPKGVELFVREAITDLSKYALGSANNGQGTDGAEFSGMSGSASAGTYIYVTANTTEFNTFFGFDADYTNGMANINGDDAVELFYDASGSFSGSESVIDLYGDINTDGSGQTWDYTDSWAKSKPTRATATSFTSGNWTYGGANALDGESTNSDATTPFPMKGAPITGDSGFRLMSSPKSGTIFDDVLGDLWIQGMTNGDVTDGSVNVWTFNVASQSWVALTDLNSASLSAGKGFLVYVFDDIDWDGNADLPVNLHVSGGYNNSSTGTITIGSISNGDYDLIGNPYETTIDWDNVAKTNVTATAYVYDDAKSGGAGYISWNGSSGDLTDGLIAPYQGFWVLASGGTGSVSIEVADKSTSAGTFYRTLDGASDGSSYLEFTTAEGGYSKSWLSFRQDGEVGPDDRDASKLMPLMASSRLVSLTHNGENSLDINNVPFDHEGMISIPLDVMSLNLEDNNYVTGTSEVSMSWNLDNLPDHIDLTLVDNLTGEMVYLNNEMSHTFTTEPKGSFSATYEEAVGIYPLLGDARFSVQVSYGVLDNAPVKVIPKDYALSPVYPNPFNPSATVRFDVPEVSRVELQVYDVTGKLVEILLDDKMVAGQHQYTWQPQELATGTYFLRLITANQTFTQKVTYVK